MKKMKNWLNRPITWGGWLGLCIAGVFVSLVETGILLNRLFGWTDDIKDWFRSKFGKKNKTKSIK